MADNDYPDDYTLRHNDDDQRVDETDDITEELTDDPSKELGVPANKLAEELDHYDFENGHDDVDDADENDHLEEMEDNDTDGPSQEE